MTAISALITVDARGMRCPWPALRAARAMREGHAVHIHADDPNAERELAAMAHERGWAFEKSGENLFYLRRHPHTDAG